MVKKKAFYFFKKLLKLFLLIVSIIVLLFVLLIAGIHIMFPVETIKTDKTEQYKVFSNYTAEELNRHEYYLPPQSSVNQAKQTAYYYYYASEYMNGPVFCIHLVLTDLDESAFWTIRDEMQEMHMNQTGEKSKCELYMTSETALSITECMDGKHHDTLMMFFSIGKLDSENLSAEFWVCWLDDGPGVSSDDFDGFETFIMENADFISSSSDDSAP